MLASTLLSANIPEDILQGKHPVTDKRYKSFKLALELMQKRKHKIIVETGTSRNGRCNYKGDGGSTIIFSEFSKLNHLEFYSVDISPKNVLRASKAVEEFKPFVEVVLSDSIEFLKNFNKKIDFLYLDSFDFDKENPLQSQRHHKKEIMVAYDKLHENSVVMIDDCQLRYGGKGKKVIDFLMARGWKVIYKGYQVILSK